MRLLLPTLTLLFLTSHVNAQTYSQTRTCTLVQTNRPQAWLSTNAANVRENDNLYMTTIKQNQGSTWLTAFLGMGFSIPANAVIKGISVNVIRHKTGKTNVKDLTATLALPSSDGTYWYSNVPSQAKTIYWPSTEGLATYNFPASGIGTDGLPFSITPAKINASQFGFVIDIGFVRGGSGAVANLEKISVTVNYTTSTTSASTLELQQYDQLVRINAQQGMYTMTVRDIFGRLLQTTRIADPSNRIIFLNNKCQGICIISIEGMGQRKTIKAFVK